MVEGNAALLPNFQLVPHSVVEKMIDETSNVATVRFPMLIGLVLVNRTVGQLCA